MSARQARQRQPRREQWREHALRALADAGHHKGGAREAVVEFLARQSCGVTAIEIEESLRSADRAAGRSSIYRALEQLEQLGLVHRLDVRPGMSSYERAEPSGEHHHHMVCERCGKVIPFEDSGLERTIERLSSEVSFDVSEHDVVLHGRCARCSR